MKVFYLIFLLLVSSSLVSQDSSISNSDRTTTSMLDQRIRYSEESINKIQRQIEKVSADTDQKIKDLKDDIIDRINLYIFLIGVVCGAGGIIINLVGRNAIRKRVEEIISETAQKHTERQISATLNSKLTSDLIEALVRQKSDEELSILIKKLEEKGDSAITQFKSRSNEVIELITNRSKLIKNTSSSDLDIERENQLKQATEFFNLAYKSTDPAIQVELYKNVLKLDSTNSSALNNLGVAYNNLNEADKAIEVLTQAIGINNEFHQAYANRGNSFNLKDQIDKALQDVNYAIKLKPDFEYSYAIKGNILTKQGKFKEAEQALNKAVEMNPNSAEAYLNRGFFYEEQKKYDKSLESYDKAEALGFENKAHLYNNYAVLFRRLKQFDKAIEYLEKARQFNPSFPNIDGTLALIHADKGDEGSFYKHLTIALEKGCLVWNYLSDPGFDKFKNSQKLQMLIEPYKKRYFQKQH